MKNTAIWLCKYKRTTHQLTTIPNAIHFDLFNECARIIFALF